MHLIDWLIVIIPLLVVAYIGFRTQCYAKGVSDFLVTGRVPTVRQQCLRHISVLYTVPGIKLVFR